MSKDKMQLLDELILKKDMCVLATTDGIAPHTSLMMYLVDHASMKFYLLSRKDSRKNKNLRQHPHASLLIDSREDTRAAALALTIQGVNAPIKTTQTADAITKRFCMKYPHMIDFAEHPDTELIRIQATEAHLVQGMEDSFHIKFKNS